MRHYAIDQFILAARGAPRVDKRAFVAGAVVGRDVLELGAVGHTLERALERPEQWLHHTLRQAARSVLGVDILAPEVAELRRLGYDFVCADAEHLRLEQRFGAVVCGDLLEHVANPGGLFATIAHHLEEGGVAVVTTPNPFAARRFCNILADGWTAINAEHVAWFCPQTLFQLVERCGFYIDGLAWLETEYPMRTGNRRWGPFLNRLADRLARCNPLFANDFGVVLRRKPPQPSALQAVSVIVPSFDRPGLLAGVLESLELQDYPRELFEIVVVENGAPDRTAEIVRGFAARAAVPVTYAVEPRRGLVYARHSGAALARGELLLFCDDDAVYDPGWISALARIHREHPELGAAGTRIAIRWDAPPEAWFAPYEEALGRLELGSRPVIRYGLDIYGASFAIRRERLLEVGGFNPGQLGEQIVGDSETGLCRKLAAAGHPVAWTPEATAWHIQFRDRHGTVGDLLRRYRNSGICDAYHDVFSGRSAAGAALDLARRAAAEARWLAGRAVRGHGAALALHARLVAARLVARAGFQVRFRYHARTREPVLLRDWEFTTRYTAPAPLFRSRLSGDVL